MAPVLGVNSMLTCPFLALVLCGSDPASSCLVVCPPELRTSMNVWAAYRTAQNCSVRFYEGPLTCDGIYQGIRNAHTRGARMVILVGGSQRRGSATTGPPRSFVPAPRVKPVVVAAWNHGENFAADSWYADVDGDGAPDLAIGRLPVRTRAELDSIISKIKDYEDPSNSGPWQRCVEVVAQVPGFGSLLDRVVEDGVRRLIELTVPSPYDLRVAYGNWRSPFCPDPRRFRETAIKRLCDGSALWVYAGHADARCLPALKFAGREFPSIGMQDVARLCGDARRSVAIFLSCNVARFDERETCLAEELVNAKGGPVAVIGASGPATPYGLAVTGAEIAEQYFHGNCRTWGELTLNVKRRLLTPGIGSRERRGLDALAKAFSPAPTEADRRDHMYLIHFFGDPLLRIRRPADLEVKGPPSAVAGTEILVRGTSTFAGEGTLDLYPTHETWVSSLPTRSTFDTSDKALCAYQGTYEFANARTRVLAQFCAAQGVFEVKATIPPVPAGLYHLRLMIRNGKGLAIGASAVTVRL
jgi:hypothetical protein